MAIKQSGDSSQQRERAAHHDHNWSCKRVNYEAAAGSLFIIHISIYLYRISVTWIAVPVGKGLADACFTVDAARHVKLPLEWIWTEDVSGFIKQNAYGLPEGVVFFLLVLAVSLMKEIRNVHLITWQRHPTRPACCHNLSVQGVTVTAWFLVTPRWKTNMPPDSES